MPQELSHLNKHGQAHMVDVSHKEPSLRIAVAHASLSLSPAALNALENNPKGDVLATARIAGIQAAKKTPELIPLCHSIALRKVSVEFEQSAKKIDVTSTVKAQDLTGVEMEALTAVSVAALTLYDMLKAVDKSLVISEIRLGQKSGGKSGDFKAKNP